MKTIATHYMTDKGEIRRIPGRACKPGYMTVKIYYPPKLRGRKNLAEYVFAASRVPQYHYVLCTDEKVWKDKGGEHLTRAEIGEAAEHVLMQKLKVGVGMLVWTGLIDAKGKRIRGTSLLYDQVVTK